MHCLYSVEGNHVAIQLQFFLLAMYNLELLWPMIYHLQLHYFNKISIMCTEINQSHFFYLKRWIDNYV